MIHKAIVIVREAIACLLWVAVVSAGVAVVAGRLIGGGAIAVANWRSLVFN